MIRSLKNIRRLLRIARILARHDALFLLERLDIAPAITLAAKVVSKRQAPGRPGKRLARALQEAGPSFIKLGQALSTRSDLLGEELAEDLSDLQDRIPPFDTALAKAAIEAEFGKPLNEIFSDFQDEPVAAASIAQVHFATTMDGRDVAVKILRPDIEQAFQADLDLFFWVCELVEQTRPELRRLKPVESIKTLAQTVAMEMDLRFEAAAADEMAANFEGDPDFKIPAVDWTLTSKRVMTTERVAGVPFDDREGVIAMGFDPEAVLTKAARTFFNQVFRDGFFHADMHPGNLFVNEEGCLVAVDFGIMGRISTADRRHLAEMLMGFLSRDYKKVAEVHFAAGWVPQGQSVDAFTQAARSIAEPILDRPQNEISIGRLLGHLFQVTETFEMETQPQLLLLQKTMLVCEGAGRKLHPEANMWLLARPLIEEWMVRNLGAEARIRDTVSNAITVFDRLPKVLDQIDKGTRMLEGGEIKLHPDTIRAFRGSSAGAGGSGISGLWHLFYAAIIGGLALALIIAS